MEEDRPCSLVIGIELHTRYEFNIRRKWAGGELFILCLRMTRTRHDFSSVTEYVDNIEDYKVF